jgi:hypothetical protein
MLLPPTSCRHVMFIRGSASAGMPMREHGGRARIRGCRRAQAVGVAEEQGDQLDTSHAVGNPHQTTNGRSIPFRFPRVPGHKLAYFTCPA